MWIFKLLEGSVTLTTTLFMGQLYMKCPEQTNPQRKKERKKVDPSLTPHTKVTSNLIKHLTVSLDTLKILE